MSFRRERPRKGEGEEPEQRERNSASSSIESLKIPPGKGRGLGWCHKELRGLYGNSTIEVTFPSEVGPSRRGTVGIQRTDDLVCRTRKRT